MFEIPGFETVQRGPHTVLIRPEWKASLLDDLLGDFDRVEPSRRRLYSHGRVAHFSYLPDGAPADQWRHHDAGHGLLAVLHGHVQAPDTARHAWRRTETRATQSRCKLQ